MDNVDLDKLYEFNSYLNSITKMTELLELLEENIRDLTINEVMNDKKKEFYKQKIFLIKMRILNL